MLKYNEFLFKLYFKYQKVGITYHFTSKFNSASSHTNPYILGQGSKGIRQWPIKSCTSQMMIHKITPFVDYN